MTTTFHYPAEVIRNYGNSGQWFEVGFLESKSNSRGVPSKTVNLNALRGEIPLNMFKGKRGWLCRATDGRWFFKPDPRPTPLQATRAGIPV